MKLQSLVFIAAAVVFLTISCQNSKTPTANNSVPSATPTPDQFAMARATFEKNCKVCHGENGDGGPVKLEDGTKLKVPSLRKGHALRHTDAEAVKQIEKGGDGMPAFKDKLTPPEIDELVRFIRQEFQGKAAQTTAQPTKGTNTK